MLKEELMNYYNKLDKLYKKQMMKEKKEKAKKAIANKSAETSLNTSLISKWDEVWVGQQVIP